jgi:hypothetical protein
MNQKKDTPTTANAQPVAQAPRRPNETGSISVEGFVRIHDPKSKEVFVEKRA